MKVYWGNGDSTYSLTLVLDGDEWSVTRPARFTPRERSLKTH